MAVTFRGTAVSANIISNNLTAQHLMAIVNNAFSRVNVIVKDINIQNDAHALLTAVSPIVGISRITTAVTGGIVLPKIALDTSQTSSSRVTVLSSFGSSNITGTQSDFQWRKFAPRVHTAAEQRNFPMRVKQTYLERLKPMLEAVDEIIIKPGQTLLITLTAGAVAQNDMTLNNWFAQLLWYEDEISTYSIGGVVSLSGSPVNGAKVSVMEALDIDLANVVLHEVKTTNALGEWSSTIATGRYGVSVAQYRVGSTYYTATSKPYLGV